MAQEAVRRNTHWYHAIELAPGVVTPGRVDLRRTARRLLPQDLTGMRALDVGTFDGFWAFELERRGAEVVAIDLETLDAAEWPPINRAALQEEVRDWELELGRGFTLAAEALGSEVQRVVCDVRELTPEAIGGPVDLVFSGALLLHLRDPVGALERMGGALVPEGDLLLFESFSMRDTLQAPRRPVAHFQSLTTSFNWWYPNVSALRAWALAAGFVDVRRRGFYRPPARRPMRAWYAAIAGSRSAA